MKDIVELDLSYNQIENMTRESLDMFPSLEFLNISNNKLTNFTLIPKAPDVSNSTEPSNNTDMPNYFSGSSGSNVSNVTESPENSYVTDDPDYPHRSKYRNPTRSRSPKKSRRKRSMLQSVLLPWVTTTLSPNVSHLPNENLSESWSEDERCCGDYGTFNHLVKLDLSFNELRP